MTRAWYTGKSVMQGRKRSLRGEIRMASVLAFVDDLFFQAKILETAKQAGVEVRTFSAPEALLAEIKKQAPHAGDCGFERDTTNRWKRSNRSAS